MKRLFYILFICFPFFGFSQNSESVKWLKKVEDYKIQPIAAVQFWSSFTFGQQVFDKDLNDYRSAENRWNSQIRRSRLGIKGHPYDRLKFNFTAALDLVGRDLLSGTVGGANNGSSPNFRLWNAYFQWRLGQGEGLNITAGYQIPQIGRESITSALRVVSMEKSWSQNYLRRHLTGTGPGRAIGINIGGLIGEDLEKLSFKYDFGVFNPNQISFDGNSAGIKSAPLFVGRFVTQFGQPESNKYSIGHKENFFGQRKGISIAFAGSYRGATDLFEKSYAGGGDVLVNWGDLNLSGEWMLLRREALFGVDIPERSTYLSQTGFLKMSLNLKLQNHYVLTPYIMMVRFAGATELKEQEMALQFGSLSGKDHSFSLGANLFFNPNLKLTLNYTLRKGEPGEMSAGQNINNFYWQSGIGAIQRGDWLGLGFVGIF